MGRRQSPAGADDHRKPDLEQGDAPLHRGERLDEALEAAAQLNAHGIGGILDLLGEGVTDLAGASKAVEQYLEAAEAIADRRLDATISIKLSQLAQTVDRDACVANLSRILDRAQELGVPVEIDMEDSSLVSDTLAHFRDAAAQHPQVRVAIQAMLRRTPLDLEGLASLKPRVRLVKGAYAEPVELAEQGKKDVTAQFKFLTDWLFEYSGDPAFGTHDDELIAYAATAATRLGKGPRDYEIQMLYGIRRDVQEQLARDGHRVRVYIPFGSAWYPYFMRRFGGAARQPQVLPACLCRPLTVRHGGSDRHICGIIQVPTQ